MAGVMAARARVRSGGYARRRRKWLRGRRWRRAGERGSGGGCVGKRRREVEGKRRRDVSESGGGGVKREEKQGPAARARDIYDRWARDFS